MKLNAVLLKALLALVAMDMIAHILLSYHFPDHPSMTDNKHPMVQSKSNDNDNNKPQGERMLAMQDHPINNNNNNLYPESDIRQDIINDYFQDPRGANGHYKDHHATSRQQRLPRKRKEKLQLLANERKRDIPTANTISPYLKHPLIAGKERFLTMLHEAHYFNDSAPEFFADEEKVKEFTSKLPLWDTITDRLGGENPTLEGLDTCAKFREKVPQAERFLGVAGLFATGTNLLASLLVANCENKERIEKYHGGTGIRWQVNWGKHSPARYRLVNKLDPKLKNEEYLPVVTIRHPYSWMQSMCRQRYSTHWFHNAQEHCPNLVPNEIDHKWYNYTIKYGKRGIYRLYQDPWLRDNLLDLANYTLDSQVVPVRVRYKSGTLFHDSLTKMFNEWYHEYLDAEFPRLIVRLEDLVFHPKEVVTKICGCIGGTVKENFQYVTETAKVGDDNVHGAASQRTNLIKWFTKWHLEDRIKNMTSDDLAYAQQSLDPDILEMFQYKHPVPADQESEA